jgi:hypothetical protein
MRKFTQILFISFLMIGLSLSAQVVPNGGFEEWETSPFGAPQPVGWLAISSSLVATNVHEVPGHGGGSAAELVAVEVPGAGVIAPSLFSNSFPVDQKFAKLSGFVKGAPVNNDTLYMVITMSKGVSDIVGAGVGYVKQELSDFTEFSVNIFYDSEVVPDSCMITFIAGTLSSTGYAHAGTTFTIDDLTLSGIADIGEKDNILNSVGQPYPNPANDQLDITFELTEPQALAVSIFDVSGKLMINQAAQTYYTGQNEIKLDISDLTSGTYILSIMPAEGKAITRKFMVK